MNAPELFDAVNAAGMYRHYCVVFGRLPANATRTEGFRNSAEGAFNWRGTSVVMTDFRQRVVFTVKPARIQVYVGTRKLYTTAMPLSDVFPDPGMTVLPLPYIILPGQRVRVRLTNLERFVRVYFITFHGFLQREGSPA